MDEMQQRRALAVIRRIERALEQNIGFFDLAGNRLSDVEAVLHAWAHGGLTTKEPNNHKAIAQWIGH